MCITACPLPSRTSARNGVLASTPKPWAPVALLREWRAPALSRPRSVDIEGLLALVVELELRRQSMRAGTTVLWEMRQPPVVRTTTSS